MLLNRGSVIIMICGLAPLRAAVAAEVVWLSPPSHNQALVVAGLAGAQGPPADLIDLRAAATRETVEDSSRIQGVRETLEAVRVYEQRLDGELLIMDDLEAAISRVGLVTRPSDRDDLFAALAYQGFAIDRYWGTQLAEAPRHWFEDVGPGQWAPRPWVDALAVDPTRRPTSAEIGEAPQREHFALVAETAARRLPARLQVLGLPRGARLEVWGVPTPLDAGDGARVPPGRVLAHVTLGEVVVARLDARAQPAGRVLLSVPISDADIEELLRRLGQAPAPLPAPFAAAVQAMGGEVWLARPDESGSVDAFRLDADTVGPSEVDRVSGVAENRQRRICLAPANV